MRGNGGGPVTWDVTHGIRSRVKGNKIIMKCEECGLEVERKAALRAGLRRGDAGGLKP